MDANTKEIKRYEKDIKKLSKRGVPIAIQQTLSNTARNANTHGRRLTVKKMTLRNRWTIGSESWNRATGLNVQQMKSEFGSTEDYMRKQEDGFTRSDAGGVTVPTAEAAGQSPGGRRTRPIKKPLRRSNIKLGNKAKRFVGPTKRWKNPRQRRIAEIIDTFRSGKKFWWGTLSATKGMWKLKGGRITKKGGWPKGMKMQLMYSANDTVVRTKATPIISMASDAAMMDQPKEYIQALERQMDRLDSK